MSDQWTDRLSEYLDGDLAEPEQAALEAHLATCAACGDALAGLRRIVVRARALEDRPPSRDLWPGVATRIGAGPVRRRLSFSVPQLLAAGIALAVLSGGGAWLLHPDPARRRRTGRSRRRRARFPVATVGLDPSPAPQLRLRGRRPRAHSGGRPRPARLHDGAGAGAEPRPHRPGDRPGPARRGGGLRQRLSQFPPGRDDAAQDRPASAGRGAGLGRELKGPRRASATRPAPADRLDRSGGTGTAARGQRLRRRDRREDLGPERRAGGGGSRRPDDRSRSTARRARSRCGPRAGAGRRPWWTSRSPCRPGWRWTSRGCTPTSAWSGRAARSRWRRCRARWTSRAARGWSRSSRFRGASASPGAKGRLEVHSVNEDVLVKRQLGRGDRGDGERRHHLEPGGRDQLMAELGQRRAGVRRHASETAGATRSPPTTATSPSPSPEGSNAAVSVATFNGEFASEFPVTLTETRKGKRFSFTIGTGSAQMTLESFQGSIELVRPGSSRGARGREHDRDHDHDEE